MSEHSEKLSSSEDELLSSSAVHHDDREAITLVERGENSYELLLHDDVTVHITYGSNLHSDKLPDEIRVQSIRNLVCFNWHYFPFSQVWGPEICGKKQQPPIPHNSLGISVIVGRPSSEGLTFDGDFIEVERELFVVDPFGSEELSEGLG